MRGARNVVRRDAQEFEARPRAAVVADEVEHRERHHAGVQPQTAAELLEEGHLLVFIPRRACLRRE